MEITKVSNACTTQDQDVAQRDTRECVLDHVACAQGLTTKSALTCVTAMVTATVSAWANKGNAEHRLIEIDTE